MSVTYAAPGSLDTATLARFVRDGYLVALGNMRTAAAPAEPVLRGALKANSPWLRRHASEALGILGSSARPAVPAVPALAEALRDEQPYVRFNVATALARIGPSAVGDSGAGSRARRLRPIRARLGRASAAANRHAGGTGCPGRPPDGVALVLDHADGRPLLT